MNNPMNTVEELMEEEGALREIMALKADKVLDDQALESIGSRLNCWSCGLMKNSYHGSTARCFLCRGVAPGSSLRTRNKRCRV